MHSGDLTLPCCHAFLPHYPAQLKELEASIIAQQVQLREEQTWFDQLQALERQRKVRRHADRIGRPPCSHLLLLKFY